MPGCCMDMAPLFLILCSNGVALSSTDVYGMPRQRATRVGRRGTLKLLATGNCHSTAGQEVGQVEAPGPLTC